MIHLFICENVHLTFTLHTIKIFVPFIRYNSILTIFQLYTIYQSIYTARRNLKICEKLSNNIFLKFFTLDIFKTIRDTMLIKCKITKSKKKKNVENGFSYLQLLFKYLFVYQRTELELCITNNIKFSCRRMHLFSP